MNTEHGQIDGDLTVAGKLRLYGMVTGRVSVPSNAYLSLDGMVGSLAVDGGTVDLHGMVLSNVEVTAGELNHFGMILGNLAESGGSVTVGKGAVIKGTHHPLHP